MLTEFNQLKGKTLKSIAGNVGDEEMIFETDEGKKFKLCHFQD
jgi:hypothetical protein